MKLNKLFTISAVTSALILAGCGGDIVINADKNVTETVVDNGNNNNNNGNTDTPANKPGTYSANLSQAVTDALGKTSDVRVISGRITEDTTLTADVVWALDGPVFVGGDKTDSATLTIEPGTVVFGRSGGDYLVVSRDSQIMAEGTASLPIIMTSLQDVVGEETSAGQWGGVVILGNAPSNKCPATGDCALQVEGVAEGGVFGGTDTADNSGSLKYVVVKYAGFEVAPDNELNGVTFGGVGSGTTVDYLQVHANADDGVEFFGGNVNLKHLVLTGNKDDSVDWDNGYQGKIQHVYIEHAINSGEANRAIEADNDGSILNKQPQSNPTLANFTIVGNNFDTADKDSEGVYLREGTGAQIYNMFITGPSEMGECFEVENSDITQANTQDGTIRIENSIVACTNGENFKNVSQEWFLGQPGNAVSTAPSVSSTGIPTSNSPLLGAGADVATTVDGFFDSVSHVGALDGTNDWRSGWAFGFGGGVVTATASAAGCPSGTTSISPVTGSTNTCQITGRITSDLTLTAGNIYALEGPVFVGGDKSDSATLTIEAGVTVYGRSGNDYIVVSRDSKIMAEGTAQAPITFTSRQDLVGETTTSGQWGGMVLLGNAKSNKCPATGDCALQVEGVAEGGVFGGTNDEDNSGVLRYVVVKHAGYEVAPDNELNGITFGGVGSGTTVEYIQVHDNADDGVEFFGGTVNAKYIVLTGNKDDSVDWDNGYRGKLQYVLVKHAENDGEANRAIEGDNDGSILNKEPQSRPTIANMTIIGNSFDTADKDSEGVYLREGTMAQLHNFVITGPAGMGECFEVEDSAETQANAAAFDIALTNSVVACENGENFKNVDEAWFTGQASNSVAAGQADVVDGIFTIFAGTPKDFSGDTFFDNATHIGAVSAANNWTASWTVGL